MRTATTIEASSGKDAVEFAVEAERLGLDVCWVAEAWGADAPSPLGYLAARTERMLLGSGADLDHARAEQHPLGAGGQVAERRGRVRAPGLGDPAHVQAEALRLDGELDGVLTGRRFDGGGG